MENLTAEEQKIYDYSTQEIDTTMKIGTKIQEIINALPEPGTPTNAVSAAKSLAISGVVIDGETVTINNPAIAGTDVYEFVADAAQTKTAATNIAVNISANTSASIGTLTMDTQPISGDKVTIGTKVYTFVPVGTDTADGEISIGADLAGAQAAFVAAVNGTDTVNTPHPLVRAGAFVADASEIVALIGGTAGDAIATTETFTAATNIFAAVTLGSGADCSAADAITALVAAITASDTQGVGAKDGDGDTIDLTADDGGAAGNDIIIGETMAHGLFTAGATKLSGGVDGTVAEEAKLMVDGDYLYICMGANTIAGKNWRRISIGAVY